MADMSSVHPLIHDHLKDIPIKIWTGNMQDDVVEEVYSNEKINAALPPAAAKSDENSKYDIDVQGKEVFITFFYPDDYRVIACMTKHSYSTSIKAKLEQLYSLFYLIYQQQVIQRKDTELENLIAGVSAISSLDLNECLMSIISSALAVIPTADAGYLLLYDPGTDNLRLKSSIGFNHRIKQFKTKSGESITGQAFENGAARLYRTKEEIFAEMDAKHITPDNFDHLMSAVDSSALQAMMCAPVSFGGKRIGVLAVHQFYGKGQLTDHNLKLLQVFADQAAIVIHNASLYNKTKKQLKEVTVLSQQLKEKNELLLKRDDVHKTLTHISLQNKGPDVIIAAVNRMVNTSVFFVSYLEEEHFPKHQQAPFSYDELSFIFAKEKRPVFIEVVDKTKSSPGNYYLYPLANGTVFLGCFMLSIDKGLSKIDQITIEQAGAILSLELVKKQKLIEVYYKKTHEYFNELLENRQPEMLLAKGREFGLNLCGFVCVAIFEILEYADLKILEATVHLLVSKIKTRMNHREMLVFGFNNKVIILASFTDSAAGAAFNEEVHVIFKEWQSGRGPKMSAGIGNPYQGIGYIERSYNEAGKALYYLKTRHRSEIIQYENVGINRIFLNQPRSEIEAFSEETLAPLSAEKDGGSELRKTLFTYLSLNRSAANTAEKLHIHVNTLYKRLNKIEALLNLYFDNPEDVLTIQLACHLQENF
ncbi:GAF domain-containing protein [Scopulibacillus darangshiensis]|uniref:GAF domain-containing protein n=1 Tax=Scopulibacillus darangshiensis TaxID=442528 RepID=A0A4R2NQY0_9BACL|nr:helix-turn-helix domain-containing protein [Scopulibacillus darangshiensis]TCP23735.1 GAF domain-containing protein [Scopulibacillus darangshiensis]